MDETLAFLNLVLPEEGWRCAFVQQQKHNYFFSTNEELAQFLLQWDAAGYTVYHACATYKEATRRTQVNVAAIASLWADVDAGPNKPYPDANVAHAAVEDACRQGAIPAPLYVHSGRGLHLYWPLDSYLEEGLWQRHASGLRDKLRNVGLHFDPARSCDSASILRTPGTTHRKEATPFPVVMGPPIEPYAIELFDFLLREQTNERASETPQATPQATQHDLPDYLAARRAPEHVSRALAAPLGDRRASYGGEIASQCAQLDGFRNSRGLLLEPLWYACLGVLAFATDGDSYAHEWSSGHPNYTERETSSRLERCRELTGATTCAKFHSLNPAPCEACPHWGKIKSPISLGYIPENRQTPGPGDAVRQEAAPQAAQAENINLPALPRHFAWRGSSLVFQTENAGQPVEQLISTYPIFLSGVMEGQTNKEFALRFKQWIPNRGWIEFTVPHKTLILGQQGMAELARHGANIHEGALFLKYVRASIDSVYEKGRIGVLYDQFGWKADNTAFLYGKTLYTSDGPFEVPGSPELTIRSQWIGPGASVKGDKSAFGFERWRQAANSLFASGCEAQSVAVLASFAAPLMRFASSDEGGCIISLATRASGKGKTTALLGASSVWGDKQGLSLTSYDNNVTKWLTLGALGNLPIIYDEVQTKDPETIRSFVVNFTEGRDKMRASRDGAIKHSHTSWQTLLLTASNSSLVDSIIASGKADHPQFRILELPLYVPDDLQHALGEKLKNELIANTGYAGDLYISYIVKKAAREQIIQNLETYIPQLWRITKLPPEGRYWVRAVACIAVAAQVVKHLDLLDFAPQRIVDYLIKRISKGHSGALGYIGADWAGEALSDFILLENINFLVVANVWRRGMARMRPLREPRGKLSATYAVSERRLTVSVNALRGYAIEKEIPFREWIETLQRKKCCGQIERKTLTAGTDVPGAVLSTLDFEMSHEALAGADTQLSIQPGDDTTNVTPIRR
jgi:Domain of unknown function (DUF927)